MLNLEQLKAIQIVNEVANDLQELNHLDVSNCKVKLNSYLEHFESIKFALTILGISHEVFTPSAGVGPDENNASFGSDTNPQVIYYLTYLFSKFFAESDFYLYICYSSSSIRSSLETLLGSYITPEKDFFNVSKRISSKEFLSLSIDSLSTASMQEIFPNSKYHSSGVCSTHIAADEEDDDDTGGSYNSYDSDDDDSWGSNHDNEYYNDDLDMDQQSQEYWDNL